MQRRASNENYFLNTEKIAFFTMRWFFWFLSITLWQNKCVTSFTETSQTVPSYCFEKMIQEPCKAYFQRFTFNSKTNECEMFIFGGCSSSSNIFLTKNQCENKCKRNRTIDPRVPEKKQFTCSFSVKLKDKCPLTREDIVYIITNFETEKRLQCEAIVNKNQCNKKGCCWNAKFNLCIMTLNKVKVSKIPATCSIIHKSDKYFLGQINFSSFYSNLEWEGKLTFSTSQKGYFCILSNANDKGKVYKISKSKNLIEFMSKDTLYAGIGNSVSIFFLGGIKDLDNQLIEKCSSFTNKLFL